MIYVFDDFIEIFKFAQEIIGLEKNIIVDSCIFKHNIFDCKCNSQKHLGCSCSISKCI